jgi:hypothetical protein
VREIKELIEGRIEGKQVLNREMDRQRAGGRHRGIEGARGEGLREDKSKG